MRLKELKRSRTGDTPYIGTLTDVTGDSHYALAISGPDDLVKKIFTRSDFEWRIDPKPSDKDVNARFQEKWGMHTDTVAAAGDPETIASLGKGLPKAATARNSVVVSLRRTQGQGTWWWMWFSALIIPRGANVFFVLPPICNAFGLVVPLSGDPDLFLTRNGPFTPAVSSSMRGGTAIDRVAFGPTICWPWEEYVPWFRINGFRSSVTGFGMGGFGVVP
jgi:hypothetical protein